MYFTLPHISGLVTFQELCSHMWTVDSCIEECSEYYKDNKLTEMFLVVINPVTKYVSELEDQKGR